MQRALSTLSKFQTWLPNSVSQPWPQTYPLLSIHIREATWFFHPDYLLIHLPRTHAGFFIKQQESYPAPHQQRGFQGK